MKSHYAHSFLIFFFLISEFSFFKQKHAFESDEDEEMKPLIHESQHAEENSERHEVEMITTCQSMNAFIITYSIYY